MSKISYDVTVSDEAGNADSGIATSLDTTPIPPGTKRFILDLSKVAFNPATGRDQIVIGGPFRAPGGNATQFGSNDIDAIIQNGKPQVRIHYTYGGGTNPSTDRSINLIAPMSIGPGETVRFKGQWTVEGVPEVSIRKLMYFLRSDADTTFVIFAEGTEVGRLNVTLPNPAWYTDPSKVKQLRHTFGPTLRYGQQFDLEATLKLNSAVAAQDGSLEVKVDDQVVFSNNQLITASTDGLPAGATFKPLTLFKFGQQASAAKRGTPFDEWRFLGNGLFIEKL